MTDKICAQIPNEYEDCNTQPCGKSVTENRTAENGNYSYNMTKRIPYSRNILWYVYCIFRAQVIDQDFRG